LQKKGMKSEFGKYKDKIEFLGYRISVTNIGIRKSSVANIKKQISHLLYKNLIVPYKGPALTAARFPVPFKDEDFLTTISEIRRFLYGNLSELTLKKYLNGTYVKLNFKGIMSFYPLITDEEQMTQLDRWLVSTILNTLRKRKKLLTLFGYPASFYPFDLDADQLISISKKKFNGLYRIPSFLRIYKAIQKGVRDFGIEKVMHAESKYYDGW